MSIKVDSLGPTNTSSQSREVSSQKIDRRADETRVDRDSKSVVNKTAPELASPERAGELVSGILERAKEKPDSIVEAQSGLSEQRVLELLADDDF